MDKAFGFRSVLMLGFSGAIALFAAILAYCLIQITGLTHQATEIEEVTSPYEMLVDLMLLDAVHVQQSLTDVSATHDLDGFTGAETHAQSFRSGIANMRVRYANNPERLKELTELSTSFDNYYEIGKHMAHVYVDHGREDGNHAMDGFDTAAKDISARMNSFRQSEIININESVSSMSSTSRQVVQISLTIMILGSILCLVLAWIFASRILAKIGVDPFFIKKIAHEMEIIAKGDLSQNIHVDEGDRESLMFSLHAMQGKLRDTLGVVVGSTGKVMSFASGLAEASGSLRINLQHQSDSTSGVASAVEQMTASIEQVSSNAGHSEELARNAGAISDEGSLVVQAAVTEINNIASSVEQSARIITLLGADSQRISEIVGVIEDIAEQTNLLALNAAIEAARAGEQGRGFAVVADEVRKLAERTAQSTHEISRMIAEIQNNAKNAVTSMDQGTQRVNEGVEKARLAGDSIQRIRQGTELVAHEVSGISDALRKQTTAVNVVSQEVASIAAMAHGNSVAVDFLAQTSSDMRHIAEELRSVVNQFKL